MEKKKKSSLFYYIIGIIIASLGLIIVVLFLTLPLALKDNFKDIFGWICLILVIVGLIIFFIGYFFLKKANYIRLNEKLKKQENKENK